MKNGSEDILNRDNVFCCLQLLRDHLSQSQQNHINVDSGSLLKLQDLNQKLSNFTSDVYETSSSLDKNKQIKDLSIAAKTDQNLLSIESLRDTLVFSDGDAESQLMFIGEAPGYEEEKHKKPFVGPSGQLLDKIISAMGLQRCEIYITNIVKYRPKIGDGRQGHSNRKPNNDEMKSSIKYLLQEINIIKPKLIITLGGTATKGLLNLDNPISNLRGKIHQVDNMNAIVTYHPSFLLRSKNPNSDKRLVWEDMLLAMEFLDMKISEKQRNYFK